MQHASKLLRSRRALVNIARLFYLVCDAMTAVVIANWKMHGSVAAVTDFAKQWHALPNDDLGNVHVVVCPPAVLLGCVSTSLPSLEWGGQDCSAQTDGAYTGEISAAMLVDAGCRWVLVGHSERRARHGETDALVALKAKRAMEAGLTPVVCVGETLAQREAGQHEHVVQQQLVASLEGVSSDTLVVAYEPVWAIGTGHTATPDQANAMHGVIRDCLEQQYGDASHKVAVLYGGSVKPENASDLFACDMIDGALVGGASLDAAGFYRIAAEAGRSGRT